MAGSTMLCFLCQTQPQQQLLSTVAFEFSITARSRAPGPWPSPRISGTEGKAGTAAEEEENRAGPTPRGLLLSWWEALTVLLQILLFMWPPDWQALCSFNVNWYKMKNDIFDLQSFSQICQHLHMANLTKCIKTIKDSHIFAQILALSSFLQFFSKVQLQCACAFKQEDMLSAQWGPTFLCDREIKSGDVQISWGRTKILLWHLTCNDKLTKRYFDNFIPEKLLFFPHGMKQVSASAWSDNRFSQLHILTCKIHEPVIFMSSLNVRITSFYYRSFSQGFSLEDQCYTAQKGFGSASSAALIQLNEEPGHCCSILPILVPNSIPVILLEEGMLVSSIFLAETILLSKSQSISYS